MTGVFISLLFGFKGGFSLEYSGTIIRLDASFILFQLAWDFFLVLYFYIFILVVLRKEIMDVRSGGGCFPSFSCAV